ncbi:MAG: hypothetical protein WDN02_06760 [Methylovirgula sp.]|uniref:hypothetical protein n=1 Tax=Methylovirgula sp. TaxID=1978224 RepID=UPI0030763D40
MKKPPKGCALLFDRKYDQFRPASQPHSFVGWHAPIGKGYPSLNRSCTETWRIPVQVATASSRQNRSAPLRWAPEFPPPQRPHRQVARRGCRHYQWMPENFDPALVNVEWITDELAILAKRWSRKPAKRSKAN